jgi:hypothetical protein
VQGALLDPYCVIIDYVDMSAEMSVFDLLLDRHDPSFNLDIKSEPRSRSDVLDLAMKDNELVRICESFVHLK